jgi:hypothetical protein
LDGLFGIRDVLAAGYAAFRRLFMSSQAQETPMISSRPMSGFSIHSR